MGKGKSSKKNPKKEVKQLKGLEANQLQSPMPDKKSLKSLKKIQKQLDEIVAQRELATKNIIDLNKKTKAIGKQVENSESQFSKLALNKDLQRIKASLEKKNDQFEKETSRLSKEILQFKDLTYRVEKKIQTLEKISVPSENQLLSLNKNNGRLFKKISYFEEELNQFLDTYIHPEQTISTFSEQLTELNQVVKSFSANLLQHDSQIKLLQSDTSNLRQSLQQETTKNINSQKDINSHQQDIKKHKKILDKHQLGMAQLDETVSELKLSMGEHQPLDDKLLTSEATQQQMIAPLETRLQELEFGIQSLQQEYAKQQHKQPDNIDNQLTANQELSSQVNLFNEQLLQSQEELKQHIQKIHETDQSAQLAQKIQFNETLERLSHQLAEVTDKSTALQDLFNSFQEQQSTDNEHHNELSKQYLTQQQLLEKHDSQLLELLPVLSQNNSNTQHIEQISDSLEELSNNQNSLSQLETDLQSNLMNLDQKMDSSQRKTKETQQNIEQRHDDMKAHQLDLENHQRKIVSYQQDQSVSLNKLTEQITSRSQLFSIGLIAVLAVASLLFLTQTSLFSEESAADTDNLVAQIKTDITNETFTKINAITKQNSAMINQQFAQIRDSIEQVRNQAEQIPETTQTIDIEALENNWQEQHKVLQEELSDTKTKQQAISTTMMQLSDTISSVGNQFQQWKNSLIQNNAVPLQNKNLNINISTLQKNTPRFYTIQLMGALQQESIARFIKQHQLSDSGKIYQTQRQGKPWFILVHGNYSSFSQAKAALQQLPESLQKNKPWIKKLP